MNTADRYLPIADYALLSDCHSSALVSRDGSIDWACLRRFDNPSTFARLLDHDRGGFFSIEPVREVVAKSRRYRPGTMILETTLTTATGTVVITDCFAMRSGGASDPHHQLLRRLACVDGEVELIVRVAPRFDYGSLRPWLRLHDVHTASAVGGSDALVVRSDIELSTNQRRCSIQGTGALIAGHARVVSMTSQPAHLLDPDEGSVDDVEARIHETDEWWQRWSAATAANGRSADSIERSALVLKSLCCAPTGAIVAAPTTSLPEVVGGTSNWDYRYCWVRDSTMTLDALSTVGHHEVAQGLRDFIMRSTAGHGNDAQIMYGPYGERRLTEEELDLEGWRRSQPVRVGNAAARQRQLDVYGHLLDTAHLWQQSQNDLTSDEWRFLVSVVDEAVRHRLDADAGIWEQRGAAQHFVYSKVMVWVAIDRGLQLAHRQNLETIDVDLSAWSTARDELRAEIETQGVDRRRGHFVQHYNTSEVDASLLKLPLVGFVDACDDRMLATVDVIRRQLAVPPHGFLRRYASDDREGVFLLCSFWLVEVLALQDRLDEAERLFQQLLGLANDVGLLAEEYDVAGGELLGNFPQAFTHIGVVSAATTLDRLERQRFEPADDLGLGSPSASADE